MLILFAAMLFTSSASFYATPSPATQANVGINGFFSVDKAQRGRTIQAAIVLDIPEGFHVNANKPLSKHAIPTTLKIEAANGVRTGPIIFPRGNVRSFSFDKLAVYEGKAILRFNVMIPANHQLGITELRARLRYQGCNDEVCYPPVTREIALPIAVVGANESVKRINGQYFGGRK